MTRYHATAKGDIPYTAEEEAERDAEEAVLAAAAPQRVKAAHNKGLLDQILPLQQKALRALVEDAPDTTFLDQHKAKIAALRSQWEK